MEETMNLSLIFFIDLVKTKLIGKPNELLKSLLVSNA